MRTLTAVKEIEAIEKRCENERNDAIWSVLVSPFVALKDLLNQTGGIENENHVTAGVAAR